MPKVIPSVKAVIVDNARFLILKQTRPFSFYWDLPGGKMEYGEDTRETLLRGVKEEVDLNIEIGKIAGVWWFFSPTHKDQVVCISYLCWPENLEVDISKNPACERIEEYRWVTKEEFLNGEFNNGNKSLIDFISSLNLEGF